MKKSKTKLEKILFNKYPVWVVKDEDGGVIWINLHTQSGMPTSTFT